MENLLEMKPLLKTEYTNVALSLPKAWRDFFDKAAENLGISRNAAFCMALKFGGPMIDHMLTQAKQTLLAACGNCASSETTKILGTPSVAEIALEPSNENKRTERTTQARGCRKRSSR